MNTSDSFILFVNQLSRDLTDINDRLALIGILYLGKKSIESFRNLSRAIGHYLIPAFLSNEKWIKSLGDWALIFGKQMKILLRMKIFQLRLLKSNWLWLCKRTCEKKNQYNPY